MKSHRLLFMLCGLLIFGLHLLPAQNPYERLGVQSDPLTLSQGRYQEFFPNDTLVQIGPVIFNTITQKVVGFVEPDSSGLDFPADVSSRWLSPDPLAAKYPEMSPYVGIGNNPIIFVDPDGREIVPKNLSSEQEQLLQKKVQRLQELGQASEVVNRIITQAIGDETLIHLYGFDRNVRDGNTISQLHSFSEPLEHYWGIMGLAGGLTLTDAGNLDLKSDVIFNSGWLNESSDKFGDIDLIGMLDEFKHATTSSSTQLLEHFELYRDLNQELEGGNLEGLGAAGQVTIRSRYKTFSNSLLQAYLQHKNISEAPEGVTLDQMYEELTEGNRN